MATIQDVIRSINRELVPQFEERLRQCLLQQDKEWLIDQIIRLSLDAHSLEEMDRMVIRAAKARKRAERAYGRGNASASSASPFGLSWREAVPSSLRRPSPQSLRAAQRAAKQSHRHIGGRARGDCARGDCARTAHGYAFVRPGGDCFGFVHSKAKDEASQ